MRILSITNSSTFASAATLLFASQLANADEYNVSVASGSDLAGYQSSNSDTRYYLGTTSSGEQLQGDSLFKILVAFEEAYGTLSSSRIYAGGYYTSGVHNVGDTYINVNTLGALKLNALIAGAYATETASVNAGDITFNLAGNYQGGNNSTTTASGGQALRGGTLNAGNVIFNINDVAISGATYAGSWLYLGNSTLNSTSTIADGFTANGNFIYGGSRLAGEASDTQTTSSTINNGTYLELNNSTVFGALGGSHLADNPTGGTNTSVINGGTKVVINGGTYGAAANAYDSFFGGGSQIQYGTSQTSGGSEININGGNFSTPNENGRIYVVGGDFVSGENSTSTIDTTKVAISGFDTTVQAYVVGGTKAQSGSESVITGSSSVVINGGSVSAPDAQGPAIIGGSIAQTGATAIVQGDTNVEVYGGTVNGNVYGGGSGEGSTVQGDTNVVLAGGSVNGNVYGAGSSDTVEGSTNVVLKNRAAVSGAIYGGGVEGSSTIVGSKNLVFDNYDNSNFKNSVSDFNNVGFENESQVVLNGSAINVDGNFNVGATPSENSEGFTTSVSLKNGSINVQNGAVNIGTASDATLSINGGSFSSPAVNIGNKGTFYVSLYTGILSSTDVNNEGSLILRRGTLTDGEQTGTQSYTGSGQVKAFGGYFNSGVFTAGKSTDHVEGETITVGQGETDSQRVNYLSDSGKQLRLDFDATSLGSETVTINSITEVLDQGNIEGLLLSGFNIVADYTVSEIGVVLSAYIGSDIDVANILAWHKATGSDTWEQIDAAIEFEDGMASIIVDGFSSYAFSMVPEPSTYAAILGAITLGLAAYRRRRSN